MGLSCITQEHGETVDHFLERLQTMAQQTELQDEKQILQYFIQGIRQGLIHPDDLDEAVEAARAEGVEVMVPERGQVCTASGGDGKKITICDASDSKAASHKFKEKKYTRSKSNLGVTLDDKLLMDKFVSQKCSSASFALYKIGKNSRLY